MCAMPLVSVFYDPSLENIEPRPTAPASDIANSFPPLFHTPFALAPILMPAHGDTPAATAARVPDEDGLVSAEPLPTQASDDATSSAADRSPVGRIWVKVPRHRPDSITS